MGPKHHQTNLPLSFILPTNDFRCAVCMVKVTPPAALVMIEVTVARPGDPEPPIYRMYACSSDHAAEAMRRAAGMVDNYDLTTPGLDGVGAGRQFGVLVEPTD